MSSIIRTVLFTAVFAFVNSSVWAQAIYKMSVSGASPSGLYSLLGIGIDGAVKASFPGSTITYQTSGGGLANVAMLDQGKVELGIALDAEVKMAVEGAKPFSKPIHSLRAIAELMDEAPMHMIISKAFAEKYGIRTFEDIAAKKPPLRVIFNKRGNLQESVTAQMFNAIGVSKMNLESWGGKVIYAGSDEQTDLMKNGRADMFTLGVFVGFNAIQQVAGAMDLVLLTVSEPAVKKVNQEFGTRRYVIKGGSYTWQPQDVLTVTTPASLLANENMNEKTAYDLAKALYKNFATLQAVHPSFKKLGPEFLASHDVVPYHKGAERFYREAGLIK